MCFSAHQSIRFIKESRSLAEGTYIPIYVYLYPELYWRDSGVRSRENKLD